MSEHSFYHIDKSGKISCIPTVEDALAVSKGEGFIWLLLCEPKIEELSMLIEPLDLHPLSIEDCVDDKQIPKIEDFPKNTFILFNYFSYSNKKLMINEINLFIGKNFLVTVYRRGPNGEKLLDGIEHLVVNDIGNIKQGPSFLMHVVIDYIVDKKFEAIETLEIELENAEETMLLNPSNFNLVDLLHLRHDLLALRKSLIHEREIFVKICRKDCPFITEKAIYHYRDIYDHLAKILELTETFREIVTSLMEIHLSLLNNQMAKAANQTNSTVRRLTFITTIFMPLTLLAGIGGMSEWSMMTTPANWKISYPAFLLGMIIIGIGTYFLLKRLEKIPTSKT